MTDLNDEADDMDREEIEDTDRALREEAIVERPVDAEQKLLVSSAVATVAASKSLPSG